MCVKNTSSRGFLQPRVYKILKSPQFGVRPRRSDEGTGSEAKFNFGCDSISGNVFTQYVTNGLL